MTTDLPTASAFHASILQRIRDAVAAGRDLPEIHYDLIVAAAGVDVADLSPETQRTLRWLADWDQPTTAGLVELLTAARRSNDSETRDVDYEAGKKDAALARRGVPRLEPDYGTNTNGLARYRQGREDG